MLSTKSLLNKRLLKNPLKKVFPSKKEGENGDIQLARINGKGEFLLGKINGNWYSTKLSNLKDTNFLKSKKIKTSKIHGKGGLALSLTSKSTTITTIGTKSGTSSTTTSSILEVGNGIADGIISSHGSKNLVLKSGYSNSSDMTINGTTSNIDTILNGTGKFTFGFNSDNAAAGQVRIKNLSSDSGAGASLSIETKHTNSDPCIRYVYQDGTASNDRQWATGFDGSDSDKFKLTYLAGDSATLLTSSNGTTKLTIDTSGNMTLGNIAEIGSDTDKILMSDSGVVKYVTGANLRSYIGAGTSSLAFDGSTANGVLTYKDSDEMTVESNLTYDGTTLTATGTATTAQVKVDKNYAGTDTSTSRGMYIDYDHTGISGLGQTIANVGLDLDINSDSITHVGNVNNIGIDIDLVAATSGTQTNTGIAIDVDGADTNIGLLINTAGTHIKLEANADTNDYARFTLADTGDLTIATVGDGTTDSDLTLDADGVIKIDAAPVGTSDSIQFIMDGNVSAAFQHHHSATYLRLYENGGASTDDYMDICCLADGKGLIQTVDNAGADAHLDIYIDGHVNFDGCGVGFDLVTPTYNAANTNVDFKTGNKQFVTFGSGIITDLNLKFPAVSGNFVVLLKQDGTGSRLITNYKALDSAGNAANGSSTVKFAGGSNPTLTTDANHVDIISIFWDADNEIAYGVASLDFQF